MPDTHILDPLPNLPCVNLPLVHEYVDGTLDPATLRRVGAHLATCEVCDGERAFVVELRAQSADMPRLAPPDHLWDAIEASLGAAVRDGDDGDVDDSIPQWATGTFGADLEPPVRHTRRVVRWQGWVAGLSLSAAAAAVLAPSMLGRLGTPMVASRPPVSVVETQASGVGVQPAGTVTGEPAEASRDTHLAASSSQVANVGAAIAATPSSTHAPRVAAQTASTQPAPTGNPLLSTSSSVDGFVLSGVSLDRSSGSRQAQQAELAIEQEKLQAAEAAINACVVALRDNPNDPRINLEWKRALATKERALQVIMAARRDQGSPEAFPVSLEPAGPPRAFRW